MHSYPSSGSFLPSQLTGPSNFPSIPMNMSLAPQNGPFQPAFRGPVCMSVLQGSHHAYRSLPGSVTMSAVQGSQVHHHHHHYHPQIGFEQMRRYQHAFHAQAQAYFQWHQQMAAMQSAQIFGPHPFQPFPISPIHTASHRNPLHQQYSQRSANGRRFNKDQPACPGPMCMPELQGSHPVYYSQPGTVTMSAVQGSQVHHHHHHYHPQIGFEQMRSYSLAYHAQAQSYLVPTDAMQSAQIFGPHPFQPFPITRIHNEPHMNPLHHQRKMDNLMSFLGKSIKLFLFHNDE
ncbi:Protein CBG22459 [Caenorhabditis briggsae]|uniref:Protein CBG22459 n=1 Tax=Caenorhabditis briggsae TaxID=6238 RepID=A8Y2C1_CAEBR|nr:Protein CBG22459 [Caenorhabditis briggsae]CAP39042.2 Protein CBG22459 [Caenorhabditis briggsae]